MLINVKEAISKSNTLLHKQRQKDYYSSGEGLRLFSKAIAMVNTFLQAVRSAKFFVLVVLFCVRLQIMTTVSRILQRCYGRPLFEG